MHFSEDASECAEYAPLVYLFALRLVHFLLQLTVVRITFLPALTEIRDDTLKLFKGWVLCSLYNPFEGGLQTAFLQCPVFNFHLFCVRAEGTAHVWTSKKLWGSQFSASNIWIPRIKLRMSGLAVRAFTCHTTTCPPHTHTHPTCYTPDPRISSKNFLMCSLFVYLFIWDLV